MENISDLQSYCTTKRLRLVTALIPGLWGCFAGGLAVALLQAIIRATDQEMRIIFVILTPVAVIGLALTILRREQYIRPVAHFLERLRAGSVTEADSTNAFRAITNMPRAEVINGLTFWYVVPFTTMFSVYFLTDTLSLFSIFVIEMAGVAAGTYSHIFIFVQEKDFLAPYRALIAQRIADPSARTQLIQPVSMALKMSIVVSSLILMSTFFSVTMGQTRLLKAVEGISTSAQALALDNALAQLQLGAQDPTFDPSLSLAPQELTAKLGQIQFVLVERETQKIVSGPTDILLAGEIEAVLDTDLERGDKRMFNTPNLFSWTTLPDRKHILIAVTPGVQALQIDKKTENFFLLFVAVVATVLSLAAVHFLAKDMNRSIHNLSASVAEVASGNLQRKATFESEDELGRLAREVESMTIALRETVSNVVRSADRVESATNQIVAASNEVSQASSAQTENIHDVVTTMEEIQAQVQGIQSAGSALDDSVSQSAASARALNDTEAELTQSSDILAASVKSAAQAFRKMFQSIERVEEGTDLLAHASDETTSSIEEMARALREVDMNASQTAKLSTGVVESAKQGQEKVLETIRGIRSIHENSKEVAKVVGDLRDKTEEIGTIVSVINAVTDKTNLLALNAAIIAAQAGEHGRAFSVVADEIKALADQVLLSTQEISRVIHGVQEGVARAVDTIERSGESVQTGVELSAEAGSALESITRSATESGSRMQEVVSAVRAQSDAADHVVKRMAEVRDGIASIQAASRAQNQSTTDVLGSNDAVSKAADHVRLATEAQERSSADITSSSNRVREASLAIGRALHEQMSAVSKVAELLELVNERTHSNERSTKHMDGATHTLSEEAMRLRESVQRFKI